MTVIANSNFVKGCQKAFLVKFSMDKRRGEVYNHFQAKSLAFLFFISRSADGFHVDLTK